MVLPVRVECSQIANILRYAIFSTIIFICYYYIFIINCSCNDFTILGCDLAIGCQSWWQFTHQPERAVYTGNLFGSYILNYLPNYELILEIGFSKSVGFLKLVYCIGHAVGVRPEAFEPTARVRFLPNSTAYSSKMRDRKQ